jgi:hypothetical protein
VSQIKLAVYSELNIPYEEKPENKTLDIGIQPISLEGDKQANTVESKQANVSGGVLKRCNWMKNIFPWDRRLILVGFTFSLFLIMIGSVTPAFNGVFFGFDPETNTSLFLIMKVGFLSFKICSQANWSLSHCQTPVLIQSVEEFPRQCGIATEITRGLILISAFVIFIATVTSLFHRRFTNRLWLRRLIYICLLISIIFPTLSVTMFSNNCLQAEIVENVARRIAGNDWDSYKFSFFSYTQIDIGIVLIAVVVFINLFTAKLDAVF